jgi:hypothetical protein
VRRPKGDQSTLGERIVHDDLGPDRSTRLNHVADLVDQVPAMR